MTLFGLVLPVIWAVPETTSSPVVVVPVAVMVSESIFFALLVMSPTPLVLVGGNWMKVGVILVKSVNCDWRSESWDLRRLRSGREAKEYLVSCIKYPVSGVLISDLFTICVLSAVCVFSVLFVFWVSVFCVLSL